MFRGKYQKLTQYIPGVPQKVNAGGALNAPPRGKLLIQNPVADRVKGLCTLDLVMCTFEASVHAYKHSGALA